MSLCFALPGMSYEQTVASMTLFAQEAVPLVRAFDEVMDKRRTDGRSARVGVV
jgi:hypothetical protein